MRRPGFGCALIFMLLAPVLPAPAVAANANVFFEDPDVHYTGGEGIDAVATTVDGTPEWIFKHGGFGGSLMTAGAGCTDVNADGTEIACDITPLARIDLGGGDDHFSGGADDNAVVVRAGPGDDSLILGSGADNTLDGEGGSDTIDLGDATGESTIEGGSGEDVILRPTGPDLINGGDDSDTVVYQTTSAEAFSVTLDDQRNDGPIGTQNVHSDVENLTGGPERDHFVGSDAANLIKGGQGNDEIDGGPGQDTLEGGEDEDTIRARDGEPDTVDCGFGQDTAFVDVIDTVVRCEVVYYPDIDLDGSGANVDCEDHNASIHPGATDVAGDGIDQDCSGADAPLIATALARPPSGSLGKKALIRNGSGSPSFRCRAPAGDTCSVKGNLLTKGKSKKIGTVSGRVAGGKTGPLTVRLNGSGRQLLEESGKLSATIRATVTNEAGASSRFTTTIQLRPSPKPKQA